MSEPLSLLEFLQELVSDAGMRDRFLADPHATLADLGLADLSPADVHDALVLVEDTQTADFSADFTAGLPDLAGHVPPAPPPHAHPDAVGYLSSYLTGEQPVLDADDLDVDRLADLDGASWPPDDTAGFGVGARIGSHDVGDQFGTPAQVAPADPDADVFDMDEVTTTESNGPDFGGGSDLHGGDLHGSDQYDSDLYGEPWADPSGDPGSDPGSVAEHHDGDF
ncbi:IniB N-terminal domain-containing protein [Pseudonocardia aurantiaca]|uniref:IniB N-terminal domain-containing protein n=1 Tax=Pseudonocardia aurantiaca TaxID=75290 RepID=A0ABW4FCC1_9PSEU